MFVFGFVVLALQPNLPLNSDPAKGMLAPTTIFNTVASFLTNTNLQHYSGEVHLSYFSQVVFVVWNMFVSAAVGICAVTAVIRALRGERTVGNFYLDMWRTVMYVLLPPSLLTGVLLVAAGVPMTFQGDAERRSRSKRSRWERMTREKKSLRWWRAARWRPFCRSSTWAPTAAASSGPTRPTRSRTPLRGRTTSKTSPSCSCPCP